MGLAWQLKVARLLRQLHRPLLAAGAAVVLWWLGVKVGSEMAPVAVSMTVDPALPGMATGEPTEAYRPVEALWQAVGTGANAALAAPAPVAAAGSVAAATATAPAAPPEALPPPEAAAAGTVDEGEAANGAAPDSCGEGGPTGGRKATGPRPPAGEEPERWGTATQRAAPERSAGPIALLDLNAAGPQELDALPGIGPTLARRIVEFREQYGPFRRVDDLLEVPGIGPVLLQRIKDRVKIDPEA